ncbi:hypothetical protein [Cellulomonas xiejunii]|uniref:Transglutaminase-like domain-containing protein n=1 Tax=Cellulomonas xiejunii TaxID=2968083 RepID=A0ABY5KU13_9CELL|nr:hypothetical protein [Cellulomonas xiejunii]MCC2321241.1 hypothetical protein [Cellulomonas xiejunii]UUI71828.1 hypothetical protein NP048_18910 [Cellulomonas xiejunii]
MPAEDLGAIVGRVRLVPDRYRIFDKNASTALRIYRLDASLLTELLDLGFPHDVSGGELFFDDLDLANVSLALRLPSPRYLAMRRWPEIFRTVGDGSPISYQVEVSAECGWAEPRHACEFQRAAELNALGADAGPSHQKFMLQREVGGTGRAQNAPDGLDVLFAEVSEFRFHILPLALYGDLSFVAETSLANCELASLHLARRATEEGWEARRSFGLLVSSPYSLPHFWPEVRLGGAWTAFDPHMINSLVRWDLLTPSEVPTAQAMSSAVLRLADEWVDLVQDAGRAAPVSLLTRRRPGTAPALSSAGPVGEATP